MTLPTQRRVDALEGQQAGDKLVLLLVSFEPTTRLLRATHRGIALTQSDDETVDDFKRRATRLVQDQGQRHGVAVIFCDDIDARL